MVQNLINLSMLSAAAFLMTEAVMPYFSTSGAIIHISSVRAKHSEPMSEVGLLQQVPYELAAM